MSIKSNKKGSPNMRFQSPTNTDVPGDESIESRASGSQRKKAGSEQRTGSTIVRFLSDARTEWALRFGLFMAVSYVFLFYVQGKPIAQFDYSLVGQLFSGGNMVFYNVGWHNKFGLYIATGSVVGGALLSVAWPFFQIELWKGWLVFMVALTFISIPCGPGIGYLNNIPSIAFIVVLVMIENIYMASLRFVTVLNVQQVWTDVIFGQVISALLYIIISWALFAIPPWHSGRSQAHLLVGTVMDELNDGFGVLVKGLQKTKSHEIIEDERDEVHNDTSCLVSVEEDDTLNQTLIGFSGDIHSGLSTSGEVSLYSLLGLSEISVFYPGSCVDPVIWGALAHWLDSFSFQLWLSLAALGHSECLGPALEIPAVRKMAVVWAKRVHRLMKAVTNEIRIERKAKESRKTSIREKIERSVWFNAYSNTETEPFTTTYLAKRRTTHCLVAATKASTDFHEVLKTAQLSFFSAEKDTLKENDFVHDSTLRALIQLQSFTLELVGGIKKHPLPVYKLPEEIYEYHNEDDLLDAFESDFSDDDNILTTNDNDDINDPNDESSSSSGVLVRVTAAVRDIQDNTGKITISSIWTNIQMFFFFEILLYFQSLFWILKNSCKLSTWKSIKIKTRRHRRWLQWVVGVWVLYAISTFYRPYRELLEGSSTNPWTLVAFFVTFRSSVEATASYGLLRSTSQVLGAFFAGGLLGISDDFTYQLIINIGITVVLVWFIKPPGVYPTTFNFKWDSLTTDWLEAFLTAYHVVGTGVRKADPMALAKARAVSQCLGSASAILVSLVIFPIFSLQDAERHSEKLYRLATAALSPSAGEHDSTKLVNAIRKAQVAKGELGIFKDVDLISKLMLLIKPNSSLRRTKVEFNLGMSIMLAFSAHAMSSCRPERQQQQQQQQQQTNEFDEDTVHVLNRLLKSSESILLAKESHPDDTRHLNDEFDTSVLHAENVLLAKLNEEKEEQADTLSRMLANVFIFRKTLSIGQYEI